MIWYSHVFKNFPEFVVVHTVKCFDTVNKAEVDIYLELFCFFYDLTDVGKSLVPSTFYNSSLDIWKLTVHLLLKPGLKNFENYFTSM